MNKSIIIAGALAGALIGSAILIDGELDRRHANNWFYNCMELVHITVIDLDAHLRMQNACLAGFVDRGGY